MTALLAGCVFLLTLWLVIARPRGLSVAYGAAAGALLALGLGLVHLSDVVAVWHATWKATFTLIALIVLSLLLDEAGLFRFLALLVLFGALLVALFANDGAVLILTPIGLELCGLLGFSRAASVAVLFAVGFIVDAAVVLASLGVLWGLFRRALPPRYDPGALPEPVTALRDPVTSGVGAGLMGVLLAGFFLAPALHLPVSVVALLAAAALLLTARGRGLPVVPVLRAAPWDVVVFSLGMYLVVYALRDAGLTAVLRDGLAALAPNGSWTVAFGTGGLIAALSAITNNLPAVLIGALSIKQAPVPPSVQELMVYVNVVAADIGPKLTPIGSLATLLLRLN